MGGPRLSPAPGTGCRYFLLSSASRSFRSRCSTADPRVTPRSVCVTSEYEPFPAAYVAAPGALGALGLLSDRIGFFVAGPVLGLPLSFFGNVLVFVTSALVIGDPTAEGPGVMAFTVALTAVIFSGGAALQFLVARAFLARRSGSRQHQ